MCWWLPATAVSVVVSVSDVDLSKKKFTAVIALIGRQVRLTCGDNLSLVLHSGRSLLAVWSTFRLGYVAKVCLPSSAARAASQLLRKLRIIVGS